MVVVAEDLIEGPDCGIRHEDVAGSYDVAESVPIQKEETSVSQKS